jgi:hypothetical protein
MHHCLQSLGFGMGEEKQLPGLQELPCYKQKHPCTFRDPPIQWDLNREVHLGVCFFTPLPQDLSEERPQH